MHMGPVSEKNTATHIQLEDGNVIGVERKAKNIGVLFWPKPHATRMSILKR